MAAIQDLTNDSATETAIALSKAKLVQNFVGCVAFVVCGILIWCFNGSFQARVAGVFCAGFFGLCGLCSCLKLFDRRPGLIIDREGLVDNSSGIAAGRIPWNEITGIRLSCIERQEFLTIDTVDPQKYIRRGTFFHRMLNVGNNALVGGPINISSHSLDISLCELCRILEDAMTRYKV
ncbi:MAG: STM3941 family protein [Planctomycetota bacterium]